MFSAVPRTIGACFRVEVLAPALAPELAAASVAAAAPASVEVAAFAAGASVPLVAFWHHWHSDVAIADALFLAVAVLSVVPDPAFVAASVAVSRTSDLLSGFRYLEPQDVPSAGSSFTCL